MLTRARADLLIAGIEFAQLGVDFEQKERPAVAATEVDVRLVESVLAEFRPHLPASVSAVSHRFDTDAAGEDAVFIVLSVEDSLRPSRDQVRGVADFGDRIRQRLLDQHVHAWPYLSVVSAVPAP